MALLPTVEISRTPVTNMRRMAKCFSLEEQPNLLIVGVRAYRCNEAGVEIVESDIVNRTIVLKAENTTRVNADGSYILTVSGEIESDPEVGIGEYELLDTIVNDEDSEITIQQLIIAGILKADARHRFD